MKRLLQRKRKMTKRKKLLRISQSTLFNQRAKNLYKKIAVQLKKKVKKLRQTHMDWAKKLEAQSIAMRPWTREDLMLKM
jgi:hypothetical protein